MCLSKGFLALTLHLLPDCTTTLQAVLVPVRNGATRVGHWLRGIAGRVRTRDCTHGRLIPLNTLRYLEDITWVSVDFIPRNPDLIATIDQFAYRFATLQEIRNQITHEYHLSPAELIVTLRIAFTMVAEIASIMTAFKSRAPSASRQHV